MSFADVCDILIDKQTGRQINTQYTCTGDHDSERRYTIVYYIQMMSLLR